jgi:hypothetical protein
MDSWSAVYYPAVLSSGNIPRPAGSHVFDQQSILSGKLEKKQQKGPQRNSSNYIMLIILS